MTRHRTTPDTVAGVLAAIDRLVELVQVAPGFRSLEVGRSPDDTDLILIASTWDDAGSARRGMTSSDVRMHCWDLFATAIDEPTSFETIVRADSTGATYEQSSLAADSTAVRLGEAAAPSVEVASWLGEARS